MKYLVTVQYAFPSGNGLTCKKTLEAADAREAELRSCRETDAEFLERAERDAEFRKWFEKVERTVTVTRTEASA